MNDDGKFTLGGLLQRYGNLALKILTPLMVAAFGMIVLKMDARYDQRYASVESLVILENILSKNAESNLKVIDEAIEIHALEFQHITAEKAIETYVSRREFERRLDRDKEEINRRFDEILQAVLRLDDKLKK
jgi:hypothetical protein